jgi:excisionase family DNA binding protein
MEDSDLLTTVESAELLGIERSTLSRWTKDGRITPAMRFPGKTGPLLYRRADVEALKATIS